MANVKSRPEAADAAGTPEAFAAVYSQFFPPIVRYLQRRLGDSAADDAAAEVFLRAFRKRAEMSPAHDSVLPWLYAIAGNVIAEQRRSERRRLRAMERLAGQRTLDRTVDPADRLNTDPRLIRALRRLTPADRETVLLIAWGELSREEAAVALGVPAGTVRSRLSRARAQLDRALQGTDAAVDFRPITGDTNV